MNLDEAKDVIKRTVPITRYLGEPDRNGFCNCPVCRSGEKVKNTPGVKVYPETNSCFCFSCRWGGDVISAYRAKYGVGYKDAITELASVAGIEVDGKSMPERTKSVIPKIEKKQVPEPHKDYTRFVNLACRNITRTNYFQSRGLTSDTIKRFRLGFKPDYITYTHENGEQHERKIPVVIIPYNRECSYYIAHAVNKDDIEGGRKHLKPSYSTAGHEPVYNAAALRGKRPCFVCEAPLDAISVMQAGGVAVAVGGTGTQKLIDEVKKRGVSKPLILSFDNDAPGREALKEMSDALTKEGIPFVTAGYSLMRYPADKPLKDANELLCADPRLFAEDVKRIEDSVEHAIDRQVERAPEIIKPQAPVVNQQQKRVAQAVI